jgi:hypothetical protein
MSTAASGGGSPVSLTNIVSGSGNVSFGFSTQTGHSYVVQSSPSIGADAVWTDIETVPGDGTVKSVTNGITMPKEFFRVQTN